MSPQFDPKLFSLYAELTAKYKFEAPSGQKGEELSTRVLRTLRDFRQKLEERLKQTNVEPPKEATKERSASSKAGEPIKGDRIIYHSIQAVLERASKGKSEQSDNTAKKPDSIPSEEIRADIARINEALEPYEPKESAPEQTQPVLVAEHNGLA